MTIGRIGGPMLKEDLVRQGVDLSFETSLLYLDVNNMRIGVNTATPNVAMDINGITRFSSNLQINGSNIATYASNGNITLTPHGSGLVKVAYLSANRVPYATTGGALTDSANLTFNGTTLSVAGLSLAGTANIAVGNLQLANNSIISTNTNGNVVLDPDGTGSVIIDTSAVTANRVFYSGANKEILTNANLTFDGNTVALLGTANVTTLNGGNVQLSQNTITSINTNGNISLSPNGTGNVLLPAGSSNTVVYLGTNKELLTSSNFQFNGTTLQIGNITATADTIASAVGNINIATTGSSRVIFETNRSIKVPAGDTSQRPSPLTGDFRFNSDFGALEYYDGTRWNTLSDATGSFNFTESFNGDGSTTTFTLTYPTTSGGAFISLNGVMQTPGVAYNVSGNVITFTEAPISTDYVDVRYLSTSSQLALTRIDDSLTKVVVDGTSQSANIYVANILTSRFSNTALLPGSNITYDLGSSTLNWNNVYAKAYTSTVATGTAPFAVTSTTQVANLNVATAGTAGTVTTAAQPNITSVGTLTGLNVNAQANATRFSSNVATGTAPFTVVSTTQVANLNVATAGTASTAGTVTTAAQPNITSIGDLTTVNISNIQISTNNIISTNNNGNINLIPNGTGQVVANAIINATRFISNIATGTAPFTVVSTTQVANLNVATAGTASTAGTVTTAAQPNITSVGTLTGLNVSAQINATAFSSNVTTGTAPFTVVSTTQVANLNVATAGTAGTVTTAAQPNITSVGTLSSLTVTGNVNTSASLNDSIGNVRDIPQNSKTALYTLILSDAGKHISTNSQVNIPNTVFSSGSTISIFNNSTANISIVSDSGVTTYLAGTATTGTRTLQQRGLATVLCVAANTFVVSGAGLS